MTTPQITSLVTAAAAAVLGVLTAYFPAAFPDKSAGAIVTACTALTALGVFLFSYFRHTAPPSPPSAK